LEKKKTDKLKKKKAQRRYRQYKRGKRFKRYKSWNQRIKIEIANITKKAKENRTINK